MLSKEEGSKLNKNSSKKLKTDTTMEDKTIPSSLLKVCGL